VGQQRGLLVGQRWHLSAPWPRPLPTLPSRWWSRPLASPVVPFHCLKYHTCRCAHPRAKTRQTRFAHHPRRGCVLPRTLATTRKRDTADLHPPQARHHGCVFLQLRPLHPMPPRQCRHKNTQRAKSPNESGLATCLPFRWQKADASKQGAAPPPRHHLVSPKGMAMLVTMQCLSVTRPS